jgi:hypothetical protein
MASPRTRSPAESDSSGSQHLFHRLHHRHIIDTAFAVELRLVRASLRRVRRRRGRRRNGWTAWSMVG